MTSDAATTRTRRRKRLNARKLIVIACFAAFIWLIVWIVLFSGIAAPVVDPLVAALTPFYQSAAAIINDPLGVDWGEQFFVAATIILPHFGLLAFMFDDSMR